MNNNKTNKWDYIILIVLMAIGIGIVVLEKTYHVLQEHIGYPLRSLVFFLIGAAIVCLCIRIVKRGKRFATRTSPEILDEILCSSIWKQLAYLFLMSLLAFVFCWLLVDTLPTANDLNNSGTANEHHTFWLTICYFFDAGNLNITPKDKPGILGLVSLVVAVLGMTLLTGLFISTFTNVLENRKSLVKSGLVTYKKIRNHTVVIGFCELTESVIRGIMNCEEESKVILLTNHDLEDVRKALYNLLNCKEFDGRIV